MVNFGQYASNRQNDASLLARLLARRAACHLGSFPTLHVGTSVDVDPALGGLNNMSLQHTDTEPKWWRLSACKGLDAKMFYPDDEASACSAKTVCSTCAVQMACLEHALTIREKAGVWGGASERDRRRIIRQRRKAG